MEITRNKMRLLINFLLLSTFLTLISVKCDNEAAKIEEDYDAIDDEYAGVIPFTHFCKFDLPMLNHSTANDEDFCDCDVVSSADIGRPAVKIDCELSNHVINLTNKVFHAENLPVNTVTLILSYQHFRKVPEFIGEHLKHLDMSNNLITIIKNENFIHVTSLEHLDLSYNSISDIQLSAFHQLQFLQYLDLSSNRIAVLAANVFQPLSTLETLKLSSNVGCGKMFERDIFQYFGVTPGLNNFVMTHSQVTALNLRHGVNLKRINLSFNNITDFEMIGIPMHVESLELSGNPILKLTKKSLSVLLALDELILEDLPYLTDVNDFSLHSLPKLQHLTFEGSKNLSQFKFDNSSYKNVNVQLRVFNLRGCNLKSLDGSFEAIINQLDQFNLEGNPFNCNCNAKWLKHLKMETKIQCHRPEIHYGRFLSEISDEKLKCENFFMTKLINTMILLFLLVVCSLTIWFFLRRLNPSRRNKFQKVGPESPYQRVTIEPNRAEYSLY